MVIALSRVNTGDFQNRKKIGISDLFFTKKTIAKFVDKKSFDLLTC